MKKYENVEFDTSAVLTMKFFWYFFLSIQLLMICLISYFSSTDNKIFTWGNSSRGRLGRAIEKVNIPEIVNFYNEEPFCVTSVSCSYGSTLIATKCKFLFIFLSVYSKR